MNKISISKICLLTFFIMNTSIFAGGDKFRDNNDIGSTNELTEHLIRKHEARLNDFKNELNDPFKEIQKCLKLALKNWYFPVGYTALGLVGMALTTGFSRK